MPKRGPAFTPYLGVMTTNDGARNTGGTLQRFHDLAAQLRDAALTATIQPWGASDDYFHLQGYVLGRPATVGLSVLVAYAKAPWAEHAIASSRSAAPGFVAAIEGVVDLANAANGAPITADLVGRTMSGASGDRLSPWFWRGWDPSTRGARDRSENPAWRDGWISPAAERPSGGGTRHIDLPRTGLWSTTPGPWACANEDQYAIHPRLIVNADGAEVARFARAEDAAFIVLARQAVSVFGAAFAAVHALVDAHTGGSIDPAGILETIADAQPWPFDGPDSVGAPAGIAATDPA